MAADLSLPPSLYSALPPLPQNQEERESKLLTLIKGQSRFVVHHDRLEPKRSRTCQPLPINPARVFAMLQQAYEELRLQPANTKNFYVRECHCHNNPEDLFVIAPSSTVAQPRLQWYRLPEKMKRIDEGSSSLVWEGYEMSTGRLMAVKHLKKGISSSNAYNEWDNSSKIHRTLKCLQSSIAPIFGLEHFIPYKKNDGSLAVECISIIKIKTANKRGLLMPLGIPLASSDDEFLNYQRCLQYENAHKLLEIAGFLQTDAKMSNTLLAIPKGSDRKRVQIIDLESLVPTDKAELHNYLLQYRDKNSFVRSTYQHPLLLCEEKLLLEEFRVALKDEGPCCIFDKGDDTDLVSAKIDTLLEKHMCLVKLIVFIKLVFNHNHINEVNDLCNALFSNKKILNKNFIHHAYMQQNGHKTIEQRKEELALKLKLINPFDSSPLVNALLLMAVDPSGIMTYYKEALQHIKSRN